MENNNDEEENNNNNKQGIKNYDDKEDSAANKRKLDRSADQSHISGNNAANIKVIKNTDNMELNNSNVKDTRTKSPHMEKEKRMKEINSNMMLPNIKNQGSVDDIRGNGRNK